MADISKPDFSQRRERQPIVPYEPVHMNWSSFKDHWALQEYFRTLGRAVRSKQIDLGRGHYALSLALAVQQAICCGYGKIAAVEFGVLAGGGLLDLCKAAEFFRTTLDFDVRVYGFDNAAGLPPPTGYQNQPEIWWQGQFTMPDQDVLRAKLPDFAELIIGDVADTIDAFHPVLLERPLGFAAIDVDLYSSTVSSLRMMDWEPKCYLPAVPCYFDDIDVMLTYNDWCGEELAIKEFNASHELRKFQRQPHFDIQRFFALHILDHPIRTGKEKFRYPLHIRRI